MGIAKNAIMLYVRMFFLMAVNLYTARIVLEALGVEDYGIYNAVGGFISMFSMLSASISSSISRYLTYTIGEDDSQKLAKIFSTSIIILVVLSFIVLFLAETIGLWLLNVKMTIPTGRSFAANWVYQMSLITFVANLLSVPYSSLLVAHERMKIFAYIGIIEGFINLSIACLVKFGASDRLILYSSLLCFASFIIRFLYGYYCKRNFGECRYRFIFEKTLMKEMFGFAGWTFIGTTAGLLRTQGINMLFNVYIGPVINAAYGLSMQIFNAVNKFSGNFYMAVQPQITKSLAIGNSSRTFDLVCRSSRIAYFFLLVIIMPLVLYTKILLALWLTEIPEYTISFTRITMIFCLTESFSQPLIFLMLANGQIRNYNMIVGGVCMLNFPVAWALLYFSVQPYYVFSTIIIFSFVSLIVRLHMLKTLINFPVTDFLKQTLLKIVPVTFFSLLISYFICNEDVSLCCFIVDLTIIELITILMIFTLGLKKDERQFIIAKILRK